MPKRSTGFTLIELMVAITIVAGLAVMALYIYSSIIRSARNNQRNTALNSYQQALEVYRKDNGHYPVLLTELVPQYVGSLFTDPSTGSSDSYSYVSIPLSPVCDNKTAATYCTSYCLYATLENLTTPRYDTGCTDASFNFSIAPQ